MGVRNKLTDLNDHLFEQLERLNDEDLTPEELDLEIKRGKAMTNVSSQIIKLSDLSLKAHKHFVEEYGVGKSKVPRLLLGVDEEE